MTLRATAKRRGFAAGERNLGVFLGLVGLAIAFEADIPDVAR
jgi:hypothetical protein